MSIMLYDFIEVRDSYIMLRVLGDWKNCFKGLIESVEPTSHLLETSPRHLFASLLYMWEI